MRSTGLLLFVPFNLFEIYTILNPLLPFELSASVEARNRRCLFTDVIGLEYTCRRDTRALALSGAAVDGRVGRFSFMIEPLVLFGLVFLDILHSPLDQGRSNFGA